MLALIATGYNSRAQTCEWLNIETATSNPNLQGMAVTADKWNNAIAVGVNNVSGFIVKYDAQGNLKWKKTNLATSGFYLNVITDNDCNIYVTGYYTGVINFGNSVTTSGGLHSSFIVKYDSSGVAQWATQVNGIYQSDQNIKLDASGNVYCAFTFVSSFGIPGYSQTISSNGGYEIAVVKYSPAGAFLNVATYGGYYNEYLSDFGIDNLGNLYLTGSSDGTFTFGTQSLQDTGLIVLKIDSALNPIKGFKKYLNNKSFYLGGAIGVKENGSFAIITAAFDSINYGNGVYLKSPWSTSSGGTSFTTAIIYYDSSLTAQWARKNDTLAAQSAASYNSITIKGNDIYFGGSLFYGSTRFGNHVLTYTGTNNQLYVAKMDVLGNFLWAFVNNDTTGKNTMQGICVDNEGDALVTGHFYAIVKIFNKQQFGLGTNPAATEMFTAKIFDNRITRGYVSPGPYCAGDTIKVPFVKRGEYRTGNQFIAELSDSAGNFEGNEIELGRITGTESDTIKGVLPLFNVATNNKYRIRILSTIPVVQSYYRFDSLRLLIYSKDTANAGPDTTICQEQSIKLGTTGGSRWAWSPTTALLNPADSNSRQPTVKPSVTTEYRIIISDSSGCGEIDTDYVVVTIRPYIDTEISGDSMVCRGFSQYLRVNVTGGNEKKYWYRWKAVGLGVVLSTADSILTIPFNTTTYMVAVGDSCSNKIDTSYFTVHVSTQLDAIASADTSICVGKSATLSVTGIGCNPNYYKYEWYKVGNATLIGNAATLVVSPSVTTTYRVVLSDTTTQLKDTAEIKVVVDNIFKVVAPPDTTICKGQSILIVANVISCDTSQVEYMWDNGLGIGPNKTISPQTTTTYVIIGTNKFNGLSDTSKVTVTVRPPLKITVNADTTICVGQTAEVRAVVTGGNTATRKILWTADNGPWTSTNPIEMVSPITTTTYKVILSDGCTTPDDSATIKVTVRPPLKISVNADTTICVGEKAELRATASGGNTPTRHMVWTETGGPWTSNNLTETVTPTTTTTYKAKLSDGCSTPDDSASITITVRPPLKVTLNADTTICTGQTAGLRATATGGNIPTHQIAWTEIGGPWTSSNPIETVSPTITTTYKAVLTDNCSMNNDSATITVTVRPPLSVSISAKDSICANQILLLTATLTGGSTASRSILWTADNGPWTSNQNPTTDTPKVTTIYTVTLSDNCSPTVTSSKTVTVLPVPKADFSINPIQGCPPLDVTFKDLSTGNDTTLNSWKVELTETLGAANHRHTFIKTGMYSASLLVSNALGCTDYLQKPNSITVFEKPMALFTIKPDIKEADEPLLLYNQSQHAYQYTWDFGDGNILFQTNRNDTTYTYTDTGNIIISLVAENEKGCKDTLSQTIRLFDKINCVIPNGFTPNNGDFLNDGFAPVCVGVKTYTMTIYNRWGQVIQQCENCTWDGTYDGQAVPQGVYMYKLQIEAHSKQKSLVYGTVNVVR